MPKHAYRVSKQVLAKIANDPRFSNYYVDSDGHWLELAEGWKVAIAETTQLHEWTARDLLEAIRDNEIVRGEVE